MIVMPRMSTSTIKKIGKSARRSAWLGVLKMRVFRRVRSSSALSASDQPFIEASSLLGVEHELADAVPIHHAIVERAPAEAGMPVVHLQAVGRVRRGELGDVDGRAGPAEERRLLQMSLVLAVFDAAQEVTARGRSLGRLLQP